MLLTLDHDEVKIALMALRFFRHQANVQVDGRWLDPARGAAWYCCRHVVDAVDVLVGRIEQWQQDEKEEAADVGA